MNRSTPGLPVHHQLPESSPQMVDWVKGSAAAAAKSLQLCPTLCDPIDGSPPGSPVHGTLQARTLEWVAISFSNVWRWKVKVKSLSHVWLLRPHGLQPTRLPCPWDLPGKSTGAGCHCLLPYNNIEIKKKESTLNIHYAFLAFLNYLISFYSHSHVQKGKLLFPFYSCEVDNQKGLQYDKFTHPEKVCQDTKNWFSYRWHTASFQINVIFNLHSFIANFILITSNLQANRNLQKWRHNFYLKRDII